MKKFKKLLSSVTAAAMLATSVISLPAGANFVNPGEDFYGGGVDADHYEIAVCHAGEFEREIDLSQLSRAAFVFRIPESGREKFDGLFGGAVVGAFGTPEWDEAFDAVYAETQKQIDAGTPADEVVIDFKALGIDQEAYETQLKYGYQMCEFWGISDDETEIYTRDEDKPAKIQSLGDYTYLVEGFFANPVIDGACDVEDLSWVDVHLIGWGMENEDGEYTWGYTDVEVLETVLLDEDGNQLLRLNDRGEEIIIPDSAVGVYGDRHDSGANYIFNVFVSDDVEWIGKPMTRDLDLTKLGGVAYTFQILEEGRDKFHGNIGGNIGGSYRADKIIETEDVELFEFYDWNCQMYNGILDPDAPWPTPGMDPNGVDKYEGPDYIAYFDPDDYDVRGTFVETLGDYTYRVKGEFTNPFAEGVLEAGDEVCAVRTFLQIWDNTGIWDDETKTWTPVPQFDNYADSIAVTRVVLYDLDGKAVAAYDGDGNAVKITELDNTEPVLPQHPVKNRYEAVIDEEELEGLDEDVAEAAQGIVVEDRAEAFDEEVDMNVSDVEATEDSFGFDITFTNDKGEEVQPKSKVTVIVPLPSFMSEMSFYLYHENADGSKTRISFVIKDGMVIFTAESFSKYILSADKIGDDIIPNDIEGLTIVATPVGEDEAEPMALALDDFGNFERKADIPDDGEYILAFSAPTYVTREYPVEIKNGIITGIEGVVKIHRLGDITGEGTLNTQDVAKANAHVKNTQTIADDYLLKVMDVNNDGMQNTLDVARMNKHAKGLESIWED